MKVKALQKYYYGGREYQPGESFEMDDREDIRVLCDLGQLEREEQPKEQAAEAPQEQAPPPPPEEPKEEAPPPPPEEAPPPEQPQEGERYDAPKE